MSEMKNMKMRNVTSEEKEKVLKALEAKNMKLVYLWTAAIMVVVCFQTFNLFLQRKENMGAQILLYVILMFVVGVGPSLWEIYMEKHRIHCIQKGEAQCVKAKCMYRSKNNGSTTTRSTYTFSTELGENRKIVYKGRIGKSIETGDLFYVFRVGKRDCFFIKL